MHTRTRSKHMNQAEAKIRIDELKAVLWENSRKYYVENAPTMSDYDYDQLMHELERLEAAYPEFATPDSPTRRVGSDLETPEATLEEGVRREFVQVAHRYPMLSLGNTYSIEEIEEFAARASKSLEGNAFTYCCELKFDGTAICLTYRNGKLLRALTRGDGVVGDDVTENVRHIANIPQVLHGDYPEEFEIRGEILMPYASFEALNRQREADEDAPFANPRNAASGSLKLLDPEEVGRRGLMCTLYHIPVQSGLPYATHDEALRAAASWGLPVSDERRLCRNIEEIEAYIAHWDTARKALPFATDGIVIKINELEFQNLLGYTAKSPRWAVAFKFKAEQALTPLLSIDYQVGRTGAVTPVANLEPVLLSGTTVKRATLVNEDQMRALDLHLGDWVYVEKGGEIIPKITGVEPSKRTPGAMEPVFPATCPDCGTPLVKPEGEAKWFCPNTDGCPTQAKGKLVHFLSRKAMNVIAGEATVEQLYNLDLVRTPADFFDLTPAKLSLLDGWKEKSIQRFLRSLADCRKIPFPRVLFAIGIRYVGEQTAKDVAAHFGSIDTLAEASVEQLLEVPDIGDVTARAIYAWFREPAHQVEIQRLKAAGLQFSAEAPRENQSDALKGLSIVISGNFSISRDEMKELIERNGGKNSSGVSAKTTYLLAGSKPGPEKIRKAQELGVEIIDEARLMSLLPETAAQEMPKNLFQQFEEPTLF